MIVRAHDRQLLLITQPDHAALAARIMERCGSLAGHPRRVAILRACAEHDGGWIEVDAHPQVDLATGRIVDFMTAPSLTKQTVWPRAIARLADDPWAAALVANHAITVYSRYRAEEGWAGFFSDLTAARDALLRDSGGASADLEHDYQFVRLADLISLTFCDAWTDDQHYAAWTIRRDDSRVSVSPDLFDGAEVAFAVDARALPKQPFTSSEQLRDAIGRAPIVTLTGTAAGR